MTCPGGRKNWSDEEIEDFINIATEVRLVDETDSTKSRNANIYRSIKTKMNELGYTVTEDQLRRKWRTLKDKYNSISASLRTSGSSSKGLSWPFYQKMHVLLGTRPRAVLSQEGYGIDSGMPVSQDNEPGLRASDPVPEVPLSSIESLSVSCPEGQHEMAGNTEVTVILTDIEPDTSASQIADDTPPCDDRMDEVQHQETTTSDSDTPCSLQRGIHGQSRNSRKKRQSSGHPYKKGQGTQGLLQSIQETNVQQIQFLKESEQRHMEQSERIDNMISAALQTISSVAASLLSPAEK